MPRSAIESKNTLSASIRNRREELGLSRAQVVEKANLPSLTVAKLANIEIQRAPSPDEREALELVLGGIPLTAEVSAPIPPPIPDQVSTPHTTEEI